MEEKSLQALAPLAFSFAALIWFGAVSALVPFILPLAALIQFLEVEDGGESRHELAAAVQVGLGLSIFVRQLRAEWRFSLVDCRVSVERRGAACAGCGAHLLVRYGALWMHKKKMRVGAQQWCAVCGLA